MSDARPTRVTKANTEDIYPLSPLQKGMLFHGVYDSRSEAYFEQLSFTLQGALDLELLRGAWDHVVAQTPVLRTVFRWAQVQDPLQIVLRDLPGDFAVHDLRAAPDGAVEDFLEHDRGVRFDLEEGPLTRLTVLVLGDDRHHLVWSRHHLVADGWCISLVLGDLFAAYVALAAEQSPAVSTRRPYRDYIAWLKKQDRGAAERFWGEQLGDFAAPVQLTANGEPGPVASSTLTLDEERTARIEAFARRLHVTPSTVFQALWALTIAAFGDETDVVFGLTTSGRPPDLPGAGDMVGLFINTLPVRVRVRRDMTVGELLEQVQSTVLAVREYEYSFLPEIRASSAVPPGSELFESILVYESYPGLAEMEGLDVKDVHTHETTSFPLVLVVIPGRSCTLKLQHDRGRVTDERARQMLGSLVSQLDAMAAGEGKDLLRRLPLVDRPGEVLELSRGPQLAVAEEERLEQTLRDVVARHGERPALVQGGRIVTHADLDRLSDILARNLAGKGDRVALLLERSPELVVAQLAAWKAGMAFVPLDPRLPAGRLRLLLKDAEVRVLVSDADFDFDGEIVRPPGLDAPAVEPVLVPASAADDAYVIYTSGSTGSPKGVRITHANLQNFCAWHRDAFGLAAGERVSCLAGVGFDASIWEIWPALTAGCAVHLFEGHLDGVTPSELGDWLARERVAVSFIPTALVELFWKEHHPGLALRILLTGGDRLQSWPPARSYRVFNGYGPTETTVLVSGQFLDVPGEGLPPIGRPVANTRLTVRDSLLRLLPRGVDGELYASGNGVGPGYLFDEARTSEVFMEDVPGERVRCYATGDRVRWRSDGALAYIGRRDFQVEVRGHRVELGEIEAVLKGHDQVNECVVVAGEGGRLCAVYTSGSEPEDLAAYLGKMLPAWMIPGRLVRVESLPVTVNGKVDRRAFDDLTVEEPAVFIAPGGELEELLAGVWRDVLNTERVGRQESFFALGGDSIMSLQVVGRLKKLGYALSPRDIFEYQTVAALAPRMKVAVHVDADVPVEAPLTPVQRMFFDLEPVNPDHFNQALVFRFDMPMDAALLERALDAVVAHHDALRLSFTDERQHVLESPPGPLLTVNTAASMVELRMLMDELQGGMDIRGGRVFGAGWFTLDDRHWLMLAAHHLVVDGVSWRIITEDLLEAVTALAEGREPAFAPRTTAFTRWALLLEDRAREPQVLEGARWWRETLDGRSFNLLPDFPGGANDVEHHAVERAELDETLTAQLLFESRDAFHTEVEELLVAALVRALNEMTGSPAVVLDMESHGRPEEVADVSRTVGWFTAIHPVAVELPPGDDVAQIVAVKETLRAVPGAGFDYGILRRLAPPDTVPASRAPVLFNYLGRFGDEALPPEIALEETLIPRPADPRNPRTHELDLNCKVVGSRMILELGFSTARYRESTARAILDAAVTALTDYVLLCTRSTEQRYTPSDFGLAGLGQDQLDELVEDLEEIL